MLAMIRKINKLQKAALEDQYIAGKKLYLIGAVKERLGDGDETSIKIDLEEDVLPAFCPINLLAIELGLVVKSRTRKGESVTLEFVIK